MAIDTGARSGGRAASRIGPTPRAAGRTPAARSLQRSSRISTVHQIATSPTLSTRERIASAPRGKYKRSLKASLGRIDKILSQPGGSTGVSGSVKQFADTLAKKTGLSPHVTAAWSAIEGGNGGNNFNLLNVGTGLDPAVNAKFSSPKGAAGETAKFLKGKDLGASQGIKNILPQAAGKSDQKQLNAIAGSGWATDPAYRSKLQGTYQRTGEKQTQKPDPKDVHKLAKAGIAAGPDNQAKAPMVHASPQQVSRFKAVKSAASKLTSGHIPYVWGGGHGGFTNPKGGLDCSGAVSAVLHSAGVLKTPLTSGAMGSVLKPGPGAVTVYYNDGHTFMKIGDKYWGTSVGDSGSGGLGPHPNPSGSYLSQYNVGHVPGLGKQVATALGIKLTGGGSAVSSSSSSGGGGGGGTTAHFGGGAVKGAPGFSDKPIKALSAKQKLARVNSIIGTPTTTSAGTGTLSRAHGSPVV